MQLDAHSAVERVYVVEARDANVRQIACDSIVDARDQRVAQVESTGLREDPAHLADVLEARLRRAIEVLADHLQQQAEQRDVQIEACRVEE